MSTYSASEIWTGGYWITSNNTKFKIYRRVVDTKINVTSPDTWLQLADCSTWGINTSNPVFLEITHQIYAGNNWGTQNFAINGNTDKTVRTFSALYNSSDKKINVSFSGILNAYNNWRIVVVVTYTKSS